MEIVYMGIFSWIFNKVFDAILSPIFKFIASLLESVLGWLFRSVLEPLLINVLQPLFKGLMDLIMEILSGIIYSIYAECLGIVDALQKGFNIFSGIDKVTYKDKSYTLLELVFRLDTVQGAMFKLIAVSFMLMLLFAVLGTIRSMADLDGESQRPVSKVLSSLFRAMFKMFMIPVVSLFAIMMSCQILVAINGALQGTETSLARMVFVVSSMDACKTEEYNVSSGKTGVDIGINDSVRKDYYNGTKNYDKATVEKDFKLSKFDYLIGFLGAGFLIVVLAVGMATFITRIFDVVVLFIISPFFTAVMPLDDGEKFKAWQDLFVGKLFGGYGAVVGMQVYMMICPSVMNGDVKFGEGSTEANYLIRLIFLLGGAWAAMKMGPTITSLINSQAGSAEGETARAATGATMAVAGFAGSAAVHVGSASVQAFKGWSGRRNEAMKESDARIKARLGFSGDSGSGGSQGHGEGGSSGGASFGGGSSFSGSGTSAGAMEAARQMSHGIGGGSSFGSSSSPGSSSGPGRGTGVGGSTGSGGAVGGGSALSGSTGSGGVQKGKGQARRVGTLFSGRISLNKSEGGHSYLGIEGKKTKFGRGADGKFNARFLGVGYRVGRDGKMDKVSLPFMRLKKDDQGKWRVAKVKTPVVSFKRMETVTKNPDGSESRKIGSMYCSDFKMTNFKARYDQETGKVETHSKLWNYYQKNADGEYVKTHRQLFGVRTEFEKQADGSYHKTNRTGTFTNTSYSYDEQGKKHVDFLATRRQMDGGRDEQGRRINTGKYLFKRDTQADDGGNQG